jgi:hypothetical protein
MQITFADGSYTRRTVRRFDECESGCMVGVGT